MLVWRSLHPERELAPYEIVWHGGLHRQALPPVLDLGLPDNTHLNDQPKRRLSPRAVEDILAVLSTDFLPLPEIVFRLGGRSFGRQWVGELLWNLARRGEVERVMAPRVTGGKPVSWYRRRES